MTARWIVIWIGMLALSVSTRAQELKPRDGFRVTSQQVHLGESVPVPCVVVAAQRGGKTGVMAHFLQRRCLERSTLILVFYDYGEKR